MVGIVNVRNYNLGFVPVVDEPSNGATTQRLRVDAVDLLPVIRAPIRIEPIHYDEFGFSCGHLDHSRGGEAAYAPRLWIDFSLLPKAPLQYSSHHEMHLGLFQPWKPSFALVELALHNVLPYRLLLSDRILRSFRREVNLLESASEVHNDNAEPCFDRTERYYGPSPHLPPLPLSHWMPT
jgi:hypothetical protein